MALSSEDHLPRSMHMRGSFRTKTPTRECPGLDPGTAMGMAAISVGLCMYYTLD
jgi:hypothetical protein